jgi:hypothetical protein
MTEEERRTANQQMVDNAINLVKGWTRPLLFIVLTVFMCIMLYEQRVFDWQFWAIYSAIGGSWLGEGAVNLVSRVKGKGRRLRI